MTTSTPRASTRTLQKGIISKTKLITIEEDNVNSIGNTARIVRNSYTTGDNSTGFGGVGATSNKTEEDLTLSVQ